MPLYNANGGLKDHGAGPKKTGERIVRGVKGLSKPGDKSVKADGKTPGLRGGLIKGLASSYKRAGKMSKPKAPVKK